MQESLPEQSAEVRLGEIRKERERVTDRERLIELMIEAKRTDPETGSFTEYLADYLLEHGVIVPPCKVGDTVWLIENVFNGEKVTQVIAHRMIEGIRGNQLNPIWLVSKDPYELRFHPTDFGKTVFLTREEAEQALKERENNV